MPTTRTLLLTVAVGLAALATVGAIASGAPAGAGGPARSHAATAPDARYDAGEIPRSATPDQRAAIDAMQHDRPIPVLDARGDVRGTIRDSQLVERDDRVVDRLLDAFGGGGPPSGDAYGELFEALRVLDPVAVVDERGATVGYFTSRFHEAEAIERAVPAAREVVDEAFAR